MTYIDRYLLIRVLVICFKNDTPKLHIDALLMQSRNKKNVTGIAMYERERQLI